MNDTFSLLEGIGYSGSFVNRGRVLPLSSFDAAKHQKDDGDWFWKQHGYSNNFIFRKAE